MNEKSRVDRRRLHVPSSAARRPSSAARRLRPRRPVVFGVGGPSFLVDVPEAAERREATERSRCAVGVRRERLPPWQCSSGVGGPSGDGEPVRVRRAPFRRVDWRRDHVDGWRRRRPVVAASRLRPASESNEEKEE